VTSGTSGPGGCDRIIVPMTSSSSLFGHVAMFALMAAYLAWRPHTAGVRRAPSRRDDPPRRRAASLAALLLVGGAALAVVGGILHPHEELPNSHQAVFAEYARSSEWVWVHDLQFLSAAVVVAGFLVLARALRRVGGSQTQLRLGTAAAAATVALIAVNMAVDGVALRRAVGAWAEAAPEERASRFAAAEAVRWLEWGVNSFFTVMLGLTLLAFAAAVLRQAHLGAPSTLPLVATGLYVVMALGLSPLDRAVEGRTASRACTPGASGNWMA
jgi:hypothetical protein